MQKLTNRLVEWLVPEDKVRIVFDSQIPGFGIKVLPSGVKTYVFRFKFAGSQRELTIGRAGGLRADRARELAQTHYETVRKGLNPMGNLDSKATTMAVGQLFFDYMENHAFAPKTASSYWGRYKRYIGPKMGKLKIGDERVPERIVDLHIQLKSKPAQANAVVKLLHHVFGYAVKRTWLSTNPVGKGLRHQELGHSSAMTPDEFIAAFNACCTYASTARMRGDEWWKIAYAIQLLMVTGCRKSEVTKHMTWGNITDDVITIPWQRHKTGRKTRKNIEIFQNDLTRQILGSVPRKGDVVFGISGKIVSEGQINNIWASIQTIAGIDKKFRVHDLRHTYGTIALSNADIEMSRVSKLLNHSSIQTTERYARVADAATQAAAEHVGGHIKALLDGTISGLSSRNGIDGEAPN